MESQTRISVSFGSVDAEIAQHAARIGDRARAVGRRLVPDRRQARAPATDSRSKACRRPCCAASACSRAPRCARPAGPHSRARRWPRSRRRSSHSPVVRIAPGLGDHMRAVARADLGLVGLDQEVERRRVDIALLGQHRFERAHAQLGLGELRMVVVVVMVVIVVRTWADLTRYSAAAKVRSAMTSRPPDPRSPTGSTASTARSAAPPPGSRCSSCWCSSRWWCCATPSASARSGCRNRSSTPMRRCSCWPPAWVLQTGGHVRVDIFYADASPRRKA